MSKYSKLTEKQKEQSRSNAKKYYWIHREKCLNNRKTRYDEHKDEILNKQKTPEIRKRRAEQKKKRYYINHEKSLNQAKQYRNTHLEEIRTACKEYRIKQTQWLNKYKQDKGCLYCGSKNDLVFHHLDKKMKSFSLCLSSKSLEILQKEVEKCIVLCRSCHSKLHNKERWETCV